MNDLSPPTSMIEKLAITQTQASDKINAGIALIFEGLNLLPKKRIQLSHNIHFFHHGRTPATFASEAKKDIDCQLWDSLMENAQFKKFLTAKQRREFSAAIYGDDGRKQQPFSAEVALSTFSELIENRDKHIKKGFVDIFTSLSSQYKSHSKFKVQKRTITYVDSRHSYISEALRDFDKFWLYLKGVDLMTVDEADLPFNIAAGWKSKIDYIADGGGYEYRFFQNGNCHLIIHDKAMLDKINLVIAEHFEGEIGCAA